MKITGTGVLAVVAVVGVGYLIATQKKGAYDVTSENNLVYSGVNKIGSSLTGNKSFSLGSWFYDITHKNENF